MALYPSNVFTSFDYPTSMQSIFEDFGDLFSDAMFHPFHELQAGPRPQRRRARHHRYFTTAVRLVDFRADEVAVKVEERSVRVHAKHQEGEDVSEVRKTVRLPDDVDAEKVETRFTKEGFLVVRAPYQRTEKSQAALASATDSELGDWQQLRQLLRGPGIADIREHVVKDAATGAAKFQVPVPVRDFHPEEISVKQVGDRILVTAEHKEEREGQLVQRSLCREFSLPQGVDTQHIVSRITDDGVLMVEAPAPDLALPEPKDIPVEKVDAVEKK